MILLEGGESGGGFRGAGATENAHDLAAGGGEFFEVDIGLHTEAVQHIYYVLSGDVAGGAFGVGTAAEAGDGGIDGGDAGVENGEDIGEGLTPGVVKMDGEMAGGHGLGDRFDQGLRGVRSADANGVTERDFVTAHAGEGGGDLNDRLKRDRTFVRATENTGDVATNADVLPDGFVSDGGEATETFGDAAVDVAMGERFGGGGEDGDLPNAAVEGVEEACEIGDKSRIRDAGNAVELREDGVGIGHLRNPFGRDKATALDVAETGGGESFDELDFGWNGNNARFILEAVARADFKDLHG